MIKKLITVITAIPKFLLRLPHLIFLFFKNFPRNVKLIGYNIINIGGFFILLNTYLAYKLLTWISGRRYFPKILTRIFGKPLSAFYHFIIGLNVSSTSINRLNLIDLALRNMRFKKSRTFITVGGMALGIGAIVLLVSIGYGLEKMVVGRIARLDEMRQADVSRQPGGQIKINDKTVSDFGQIQNIDSVQPMIAVVGRVNYQNSISDMAVFGVTSDYLAQSAIKPIYGQVYDSNSLTAYIPPSLETTAFNQSESSTPSATAVTTDATAASPSGAVQGVKTEAAIANQGEKNGDVEFRIDPGTWMRVRHSPGINSEVIGYTKRQDSPQQGEEYWGTAYPNDTTDEPTFSASGIELGKWIKSQFPIWEQTACSTAANPDCVMDKYLIKRDPENSQLLATGYIAENGVSITTQNFITPRVLGEQTAAQPAVEELVLGDETADESLIADLILGEETSSDSSSVDWIEIASESAAAAAPKVRTIPLSPQAKKEAVVNLSMLKVLGIKETEAVGKTFSTSFVVVEDLLENSKEKVESEASTYTIVGIIPDDKSPVFYVPFIDLRGLGIVNYSQVKVSVKSQTGLDKVRKTIEGLGYTTHSVADTVNQINSLFATARTVLALLGMVALAVASLGMFNTLTISLLERTREVGLMKAMGMKSSEVQELFLTESMIMGFFGGLLGIAIGFLGGKLIGLLLSAFSLAKGVGIVDISFIPGLFIAAVIFLSLTVGLITGIYPARRATKISALNALRYE